MTSIPGSDNLVWSDEQTRFYLQLRIDEKLKGNVRNQMVNETGRNTIVDKFHEEFGEKHPWKKFGIKHTTCKAQYDSFRKLLHNRSRLGYHTNGSLDMSDDWWNERCKEWPGARKLKDKAMPNVDLLKQVFDTVMISGVEGWTTQQGEEHLDTMHLDQDTDGDIESRHIHITQDDDGESRQNPMTEDANIGNGPASSNIGNGPASSNIGNGPSSSSNTRTKASRKRSREQSVAEVIRDSIQSRDQIISHKNQLIENHPEFSCSQMRAMEVLHLLPSIRMWSPLYKAAIQHLKQDISNRQTFLFYKDDENKVLYLEFATGESRDA